MNVFSITDIPEFSKKERIVVVGVIGKSPYRYPNKTTPLLPTVQSKEVSLAYNKMFYNVICSLQKVHCLTEISYFTLILFRQTYLFMNTYLRVTHFVIN